MQFYYGNQDKGRAVKKSFSGGVGAWSSPFLAPVTRRVFYQKKEGGKMKRRFTEEQIVKILEEHRV